MKHLKWILFFFITLCGIAIAIANENRLLMPQYVDKPIPLVYYWNGNAPDGTYSIYVLNVKANSIDAPMPIGNLRGTWHYKTGLHFTRGWYTVTVENSIIVSSL